MFVDLSQMFEQAVDVVLKALSERPSFGARPRASSESIGRLISARAGNRFIEGTSLSSPTIIKSGAEPARVEFSGETPPPQRTSCVYCYPIGRGAAVENRLLLTGSPSAAEVLLVGECGCSVKEAENASFGGAAGELLMKMLKTMGLGRDAVNVVNVIVCESASRGYSTGLNESSRAECRMALRELVRRQPVKLIVAMGANAAASLFEVEPRVESSRSTWREFEGVPVMTTFHASHLIQNPAISERRKVWEDLILVMEKLGLEISERQRSFFLK